MVIGTYSDSSIVGKSSVCLNDITIEVNRLLLPARIPVGACFGVDPYNVDQCERHRHEASSNRSEKTA